MRRPSLLLAAMPLVVVILAAGAAMLVFGVWFAVWPASLGWAGFASNPGALLRAAGLFFFGGAGVLALLLGYGLLRSRDRAWSYFDSTATTLALAAVGYLWKDLTDRVAWVALVGSVSSLVMVLWVRRHR